MNIEYAPPKTGWMETPVEIQEHMFCHAAKVKELETVGFPHAREWRPQDEDWNVPENWETIIVEGMKTLLERYRSFRLFMDICVRCGACADKCHFYIGTGDLKNMPGITGGCNLSPLKYCPETTVTRAQIAVFLEKGLHYPSAYVAPNVAPTFSDTVGHWAEDWIEALKNDSITAGCAAGLYCPENPVTRAQMAVFLLKAKYGSLYAPPAVGTSTGFGDVPTTHWAAAWIKQLAAEAITGGCGGGNYCPENPVTRAQMAVFLVKTLSLP